MSLLTIILVIVCTGVLLWAINGWIPMDPKVKTILNIVVIVFLVIWLLKAFGVWGELSKARVDHQPTLFVAAPQLAAMMLDAGQSRPQTAV